MGIASPSQPASAIVIGDGVVGLACAVELARRGLAVELVAPDAPWRGASWGNAGHIAVEQIEPLASLAMLRSLPRRLFALGGAAAFPLRDLRHWLPFSLRLLRASAPARFRRGKVALAQALATAVPAWQRLLKRADAEGLLRLGGHFIVWEDGASAAKGMAHWLAAEVGTASVRRATTAEIADLQALTPVRLAGAVRVEGSGHITNMAALGESLRRHYAQHGGRRIAARAVRLTSSGEGGVVALDTGDTLAGDLIVVAAGAASKRLLSPLGIRTPLIAERGYHIEASETGWPADMPPVVFEDRSMIVTRFASTVRAASFVEYSSLDSPPDPRRWQRLRDHVARLGLPFGDPVSEWVGARPTLPDYLPAIGRHRTHGWLAYAFGHQHLGLTLSATTGEALGALICNDTPAFDLAPFSLDRFA